MAVTTKEAATIVSENKKNKEAVSKAKKDHEIAWKANDENPTKESQANLEMAEKSLADAESKAKKYINDNKYIWNLGDISGYAGDFVAANKVNSGGGLSWADISPTSEVAKIDVTTLNPESVIKLATSHDQDIDGKSGAGTSTVKEGEERFIFGASYSGTQGVSISEVSGVSASIAHGKRVSWLDGDSWSYQKGGSSHSEQELKDIFSNTNARDIVSKTFASYKIQSESRAVDSNSSVRMSAGNVSTVNMGSTTTETILFGVCSNNYIGGFKNTLNLGCVFSTVKIMLAEHDLILVKYKFVNTLAAQHIHSCTVKGLKFDKTIGPNIVTNEQLVELEKSLTSSIDTKTSKINVDISSIDRRIASKGSDIDAVGNGVLDCFTSVINIRNRLTEVINESRRGKVSIEEINSIISKSKVSISGCDFFVHQ